MLTRNKAMIHIDSPASAMSCGAEILVLVATRVFRCMLKEHFQLAELRVGFWMLLELASEGCLPCNFLWELAVFNLHHAVLRCFNDVCRYNNRIKHYDHVALFGSF